MLHCAGSRARPYGNGSFSGPSHALSHSLCQQRRLPSAAHAVAASYQLTITGGGGGGGGNASTGGGSGAGSPPAQPSARSAAEAVFDARMRRPTVIGSGPFS